jgi:purine-nucleoside phosphorylase
MPTPTDQNSAVRGDFAKTVLMPGDPLRSQWIAETYLEGARLVNNVRGIQGYTGTYRGVPVSVMASGMGNPSIGIYSHELFTFYDVENIIRIGTCGAYQPYLHARDIVIGMGASTNSAYPNQFGVAGTFCPIASYALLEKAVDICRREGYTHYVGNLFSTDIFYDDIPCYETWAKMGILAVEMEAAALYTNAARAGKNALTICTVSNSFPCPEEYTTPAERESTFDRMARLGLELAREIN